MKRLYKDRFDKKLGGVCGGLAQYFCIDSSVLRLSLVLLSCLTGGISLVIYCILWATLPLGPKAYIEANYKKLYRSRTDKRIAGICGGVGQYLCCDSNIVRLVAMVLFVITGFFPMIFVYIIGIAIIPESLHNK